jgi:hypothetical protein
MGGGEGADGITCAAMEPTDPAAPETRTVLPGPGLHMLTPIHAVKPLPAEKRLWLRLSGMSGMHGLSAAMGWRQYS